jgi:hypothetical protein
MFNNLIMLSDKDEEAVSLGGKMGDLLKEARQKNMEAAREKAAGELVKLLELIELHKATRRKRIKQLRKEMEMQVEQLETIDRALSYFEETTNIFPLLNELGLTYTLSLEERRDGAATAKVPEGWKPKNTSKAKK